MAPIRGLHTVVNHLRRKRVELERERGEIDFQGYSPVEVGGKNRFTAHHGRQHATSVAKQLESSETRRSPSDIEGWLSTPLSIFSATVALSDSMPSL